jgi:hypothetical protein
MQISVRALSTSTKCSVHIFIHHTPYSVSRSKCVPSRHQGAISNWHPAFCHPCHPRRHRTNNHLPSNGRRITRTIFGSQKRRVLAGGVASVCQFPMDFGGLGLTLQVPARALGHLSANGLVCVLRRPCPRPSLSLLSVPFAVSQNQGSSVSAVCHVSGAMQ